MAEKQCGLIKVNGSGKTTEIWSGRRTATGTQTVQDFSDADLLIFEIGIYVDGVGKKVSYSVVPMNEFRQAGGVYVGVIVVTDNTVYSDQWGVSYVNDTTINFSEHFHREWDQTGAVFSIVKVVL